MLISFSQGLISGLYGEMNKYMILSFLKNFWICFVRWNLQLSATITIFFDQLLDSLSLWEPTPLNPHKFCLVECCFGSNNSFHSHFAVANHETHLEVRRFFLKSALRTFLSPTVRVHRVPVDQKLINEYQVEASFK